MRLTAEIIMVTLAIIACFWTIGASIWLAIAEHKFNVSVCNKLQHLERETNKLRAKVSDLEARPAEKILIGSPTAIYGSEQMEIPMQLAETKPTKTTKPRKKGMKSE